MRFNAGQLKLPHVKQTYENIIGTNLMNINARAKLHFTPDT